MAILKCLASSRKIFEFVTIECKGICQQSSKVIGHSSWTMTTGEIKMFVQW